MKVYLAGPMRGIKDFNFPAFYAAEEKLKSEGYQVFNPARRDEERHGVGVVRSETGNIDEVIAKGFSLRMALCDDTNFICVHADGIAMLPGWEKSSGAFAEWALARALGLKVIYL